MSNSHKGKTSGMKGKKHSKKRNRKMSEIMKKVWQNPEYKEKVLKKSREGANVKPNNFEKKGFAIVSGLFPNEYMLNVKGEVMILGGKVPDIVNVNGQKKVIELFGDYWHSDKHITKKGCYEDTEEGRKRYFKKYGYSTLIIWENELKNIEAVKQKITDFHMTNTRD